MTPLSKAMVILAVEMFQDSVPELGEEGHFTHLAQVVYCMRGWNNREELNKKTMNSLLKEGLLSKRDLDSTYIATERGATFRSRYFKLKSRIGKNPRPYGVPTRHWYRATK